MKSLDGAPEKVHKCFSCEYCNSLKSLKGAPKKIGGYFSCGYCNSLKSLEGAPKEVDGDFYCTDYYKRFSKEDVKKVSNVEGDINV